MQRTKLVCAHCKGESSIGNGITCPLCGGSTYRSSNIAAIGYDDATSTIEYEFRADKNGRRAVWEYSPIDRDVYERTLEPDSSPGRIFAAEVKKKPGVIAFRLPNVEAVTA